MRTAQQRRWVCAIAVLAMIWAQTAFAHVQKAEAAGLLTGFLHPISGLDHVLAMVAVGLWGAQLGAPAIWVLPVAFPLVMAMGGMLGFMGVPVPGIEYGIAASAILLGAAVAFEVRAPLVAAALLVGFFAVFGRLRVSVLVQERIDLSAHVLVGNAQLLSRQGARQRERRGGAAAKAHGCDDLVLLDERDILDE